ncbi:NAD(P)-binding protein [Pedobacter sp. HMF7647]|uniref:NAD(P)-binding protein n=1 Tax=Hufsiella arboris TaxID=2695275 RepID=A0A7K1YEV2_9SPHI|nr:NAD(P)-binding protein [Hufsiella arboris]MXV52921.1 NAD(P)-binding protein [Hufsiella arboris]
MRAAIIGAGPAGLTIAHQLSANGVSVDVYDNAAEVGGFAKSILMWDVPVEIGPHFLNIGYIPAVYKFVSTVLKGRFDVYERKTYIITPQKLFKYPPAVADMLKQMNIWETAKAIGGLLKQSILPVKPDGTAEQFVKRSLGGYLYEHFFASFSRKLWGLAAGNVSDVFARSLLGFSSGYSPGKIAWKKIKDGLQRKPDTNCYIYPHNGLSTLWQVLKIATEINGGRFFLSAVIKELICDEPCRISGLRLADGSIQKYDVVIATIPLAPLFSYLKAAQIVESTTVSRFRCDILVYLKVTFNSGVAAQCFYVYREDVAVTRITNFNQFNQTKSRDFSILLVECWCDKTDELWRSSDEAIIGHAISALNKLKIFSGLEVLSSSIKKIENAFQIPVIDVVQTREAMFNQLSQYENLFVTGRTASISFNYGMENAIHDGLKLSEQLLKTVNQPAACKES